MRDVLQNTARKFKIYMADSSNPLAGLTGLSSFTVYLAKESGTENAVSPTITERGHGWYEVTPTTAHRDTLGENAWTFIHAGAVDFPRVETVVAVDNQIVAYDALRPTTTLRTLDVSAAGNAGIDWSNIEAPTTTVALTGTTVSLTTAAVALIWDALTSGMSTVGSIGKRIVDFLTGDAFARLGAPAGASIAADIAAVQTQVAAIVLDTNELQLDWQNGGRLNLILDARSSQTSVDDLPTNAELATALAAADDAVLAAIAALNNLSAAQVNAEVLDVLQTDTFAELAAVPAATSSLKDKLTYVFMWMRNKSTQTATTRLLRNDADNATVATETVSDDGTTYTKGEGA